MATLPYTPIAHSLPVSCSTLRVASQPDTFTSTFGKSASPRVEDVESYTSFNLKGISLQYNNNVREGIVTALKSFPARLSQDLLDQGYTFSVAEKSSGLIVKPSTELDIAPDEVEPLSKEQEAQLINELNKLKPLNKDELLLYSGNNPVAFQLVKEIRELIIDLPEIILTDELKKQIGVRQAASFKAIQVSSPFFNVLSKQTMMPGITKPIGFLSSSFDIRDYSVEKLTQIARHETTHAIDIILGKKRRGKFISASPTFRKLLQRDQIYAQNNNTWPDWDEEVEGIPGSAMYSYFPYQFDDPDETKQFNEERYLEAFAECLSALTGGGAVNPDRVKSIYKHGCEWVKHNVLMPYERPAFWKNPFKWLKLTAQMGWYNLKTNLMLRFAKAPKLSEPTPENNE